MAASALIKFTQGLNVGPDGEALVGEVSVDVHISNVDNTDVASWQFDLAYADPGSALFVDIGPDFDSGSSSTPATVFVPDVPGSYRWVLKVWPVPGQVGDPASVDIRVFSVPEANGLIVPPAQLWPLPLPDPQSSDPTAKPNEMNFGGQAFGWAGTSDGDGLQGSLVRVVDVLSGRPALPMPGPGHTPASLTALGLDMPVATFLFQGNVWVVCPGDPANGKPSSIVRLAQLTFVPDFVVYAASLNETWRNAVAVSGTVVDGCNLCVLSDKKSEGQRYLLMMNIDTTRVTPVVFSSHYLTGAIPSPDPVIHPGSGYFRHRDQRPAPLPDPQGPPSPLLFIGGFLITISANGAEMRGVEFMSGSFTVPSTVDMADAKAIGVAYDPDGAHYGDGYPRLFILSEGWSSTYGYSWQLQSHETLYFALDQRTLFHYTQQESVFQLIYANSNLYVAGYGYGNGPPLRRIDPVTLVSQAAATTLTARQVAAVVYDSVSSRLFAVTQALYQDPLVVAALDPLTLAVVAEQQVSFNVPTLLSDLHPLVDPLTNQWLAPLYTAWLDSTHAPALLAGTSSDMTLFLQYQQRGLVYAPEDPASVRDQTTLHVSANVVDYGRQDGTAQWPFDSIQRALDVVGSQATTSLNRWEIKLGAGTYGETSIGLLLKNAPESIHLLMRGDSLATTFVLADDITLIFPASFVSFTTYSFSEFNAPNLSILVLEDTGASAYCAFEFYNCSFLGLDLTSLVGSSPYVYVVGDLIGSSGMYAQNTLVYIDNIVVPNAAGDVYVQGAYVYAGITAGNRLIAKDCWFNGSSGSTGMYAPSISLRNSGYVGGGNAYECASLEMDNASFKFFVESPATMSAVAVIASTDGDFSYSFPVKPTTAAGANELCRFDSSLWPDNMLVRIKYTVDAFCIGDTNDSYFEQVGLFKKLGGVTSLRGEGSALFVDGSGPSLDTPNSLALSVVTDTDIVLTANVVGPDLAQHELTWKTAVSISFNKV